MECSKIIMITEIFHGRRHCKVDSKIMTGRKNKSKYTNFFSIEI